MWIQLLHVRPTDLSLEHYGLSWLQMPTPMQVGPGTVAVFFAARKHGRPWICSVLIDVDYRTPKAELRANSFEQVMAPSTQPWSADGVYPSCTYEDQSGQLRLLFVGWVNGPIPPLFVSRIGIATLSSSGHVLNSDPVPLFDLTMQEPLLITSPVVRRVPNGFEMLYVSGEAWVSSRSGPLSLYTLHRATSSDGVTWDRGAAVVKLEDGLTNVGRSAFLNSTTGDLLLCAVYSGSTHYELRTAKRVGDTWRVTSKEEDGRIPGLGAAYPAILEGRSRLLFVNDSDRGQSGFRVLLWTGP